MTNIASRVADATQVSEVRRAAASLAEKAGMDETTAGRVAIVVTEAATNLVKHGGGGWILLGVRERMGVVGVEMLALDRGQGMADIERCAQDGYSTAGSRGNGLGAIRRLSTVHDFYSYPGLGTAVLAWIAASRPRATEVSTAPEFQVGAVCVARESDDICGDAWIGNARPGGYRLMVADGLGHGPGAAEASLSAVDIAAAHPHSSVTDLIQRVHDGLRSSRGAAVAAAEIDPAASEVRFAGLGNISGSIVGATPVKRQMVSHNGTAGHQARKIQQFAYPWSGGSLLILHSDGISTHWSLERYPALTLRDPSLIAGVLFRDFLRGNDDASVVVVREARGEAA